jgi:hypothetical protein
VRPTSSHTRLLERRASNRSLLSLPAIRAGSTAARESVSARVASGFTKVSSKGIMSGITGAPGTGSLVVRAGLRPHIRKLGDGPVSGRSRTLESNLRRVVAWGFPDIVAGQG